MQVSSFDNQRMLHTMESAKEPFRLKNLDSRNRDIIPEDIKTIVDILSTMKMLADPFKPIYRVVATEAVRSSRNYQELLAIVADSLNFQLEIIDGLEEARLSHLGMSRLVSDDTERRLYIDLGGGSTEIVLGHHQQIEYATSVKMGGATLSRTIFAKKDRPIRKKLDDLKWRFDLLLAPIKRETKNLPCKSGVITAGTGKAIARIHHHIEHGFVPDDVHAYTLTQNQVQEVCNALRKLETPKKIRERFPIDIKRAEVILAGAELFKLLSDAFGIESWQISTYGLREGLIIDSYQRRGLVLDDIVHYKRSSVFKEWSKRFNIDLNYAGDMQSLATSIFDQLVQLKKFKIRTAFCRTILETAAYLYEIGKFINVSGYHKHSFYLLSESSIFGFTQLERNLMGLAILYSRKKRTARESNQKLAYLDLYREEVNFLSVCLRLARCLNRSRQNKIQNYRFLSVENQIELVIDGSEATLKAELFSLNEEKSQIGRSLDREFSVKVREPSE